MVKVMTEAEKSNLGLQAQHWEATFSNKPDMFGMSPSVPAIAAVEVFKKSGVSNILELGGGQGRDSLFFAQNGFHVQVLDYSASGIESIAKKAEAQGLTQLVSTKSHDIRNPLPFDNDSIDACYSHMLYCMALTSVELEFLSMEIRRVLKPDGLNIYTVRHTGDADFATGIHKGEDMYQAGGFVVHYFSKEKVIQLAKGYEIVAIDKFEEGALPRKLFRVTLKKIPE